MTATPEAIQSGTQTLEAEPSTELALPKSKQQLGLTIRRAAQLPDDQWPDERISAIRAYVGKEATNIGELAAFLATCQRYALDPMVGQLFLIGSSNGPRVVTGRDTWLSLARREAGYGGILFGVVHEKDTFSHQRAEDGRIMVHHHVAGIKRGAIIGAYCVVRDRLLGENIEVRELQDFNHLLNKDNWKNYKADMLQNRCIAAVLRKEYGFPGLLIQGEEDELGDPTERKMPSAEAETAKSAGAGAALARVVSARAEIERVEPAEEAQDVTIEPPERPAAAGSEAAPVASGHTAAEAVEAGVSDAAPAPTTPAPMDARRAELEANRSESWKIFAKLETKRKTSKGLSELEQVKYDSIVADYPEWAPPKVDGANIGESE